MNAYSVIILAASVIIISSFFNWIGKRTNIPSVLLLILLGIGAQFLAKEFDITREELGLGFLLEILGNVGLVFIVLEAALDLKLKRENTGMMIRAFLAATIGLGLNIFAIGWLFHSIYIGSDWYTSFVFAVPLSILSSAIIIPSVGGLIKQKKEFMIYESTFSDILGIMVFYFMLGAEGSVSNSSVALDIGINIGATILLSVVSSVLLVFLIQRMKLEVKLFLVIAILLLLFAVGKTYHLSSLLLILVFGLLLNNTGVFFKGKIARFYKPEIVSEVLHDLHKLTLESAFVIRTFFFVIFGFSLQLASLYSWQTAIIGGLIVLILYASRLLTLGTISRKNLFPELWIAPRGLITILLFFALEQHPGFVIKGFDIGVLLYPIFISSVVMTIGLLMSKGRSFGQALKEQIPHLEPSEDAEK